MNELGSNMQKLYEYGGFENQDKEMEEMLKFYNYTPKNIDDLDYEKFNIKELGKVTVVDIDKLEFNYKKRAIDIPLFKKILDMNRNCNLTHVYGMPHIGKTYFAMNCAKLLKQEYKLVSIPTTQIDVALIEKLIELPKGSSIILDSLDKIVYCDDRFLDFIRGHFAKVVTIGRLPLIYSKLEEVNQFNYTLPFDYEEIELPQLGREDWLENVFKGSHNYKQLLISYADAMTGVISTSKLIKEYVQGDQYSSGIVVVKDEVINKEYYILNDYGKENLNIKEVFKLLDITNKKDRIITVTDKGVMFPSKLRDETIYISLKTLLDKNFLNKFIKKYVREYINTLK